MAKWTFFSAFLAVFLFFTIFSHGQIDTFDLSLYKLPELERHQLDFSLDASGAGDDHYRENSGWGEITESQDKSFRFISSAGGTYKSYFNNRDYQGNHRFSVGFNADLTHQNSEKPEKYQELKDVFDISLSGKSNNRFYSDNLYYLATNLSFGVSSRFRNAERKWDTVDNFRNSVDETRAMYISLPVSAGKGRIEPLRDARMAVYIMDQLSRKGKLNRKPTDEEILDFARLIAEIKNERFFDARLRRVYEMTRLDSFLRENDLAGKQDIGYYTTMNDYWRYANNPYRGSGSRFSIGIDPSYGSNYSFDETREPGDNNKNISTWRRIVIKVRLRYAYEKPHNLYWQSSFRGNAAFGREWRRRESVISENISHRGNQVFNSNVNYALKWYPDSRTWFKFNIGGSYEQDFHPDKQYEDFREFFKWGDNTYFKVHSGVSGYFYLSPQVRLEVNYGLWYGDYTRPIQNFPDHGYRVAQKQWDYHFSFDLNYSLF
jgi:hypothetical protein